MTQAELLSWVDKQMADYVPDPSDPTSIRMRFGQIIAASVELKTHAVFGFSIPDGLRAAATPLIRARLETTLAQWQAFLANVDGGPGYFTRSLVAAGLAPPAAREVRRDPAMKRAIAALRERLTMTAAATKLWREQGWIEDNEHHGFATAAPDPAMATQLAVEATTGLEFPPSLEALYAELGSLWVGGGKKGGERPASANEEFFVFAPFGVLLDRNAESDDLIVLDQHPDNFSWVQLDRTTGEVSKANKLDRTPRIVTATLVEYVDLLAQGYGRTIG
ncbi:MAG TPA: hypothetical protein PLF40_09605 [Kofleriaceae bacterium]|nr:hypothetical protein [Kofleriaceae bacterium]